MIRLAVVLAVAAGLWGCGPAGHVASTALIGPEEATIPAGSHMVLRGHASPPYAFYAFCSREPELCNATGSTRTVELTPARMAELKTVTVSVNRQIREMSDMASLGKGDDWRLPNGVGDCEDFAILKKQELIRRGWPPSTLLLTVVTRGGEGHAVLTVRTDKGDFVLDNKTDAVKDWSQTPYRYFARQSQSDYGKWERIGPVMKPSVTS